MSFGFLGSDSNNKQNCRWKIQNDRKIDKKCVRELNGMLNGSKWNNLPIKPERIVAQKNKRKKPINSNLTKKEKNRTSLSYGFKRHLDFAKYGCDYFKFKGSHSHRDASQHYKCSSVALGAPKWHGKPDMCEVGPACQELHGWGDLTVKGGNPTRGMWHRWGCWSGGGSRVGGWPRPPGDTGGGGNKRGVRPSGNDERNKNILLQLKLLSQISILFC